MATLKNANIDQPLAGRYIAVPESRELAVFTAMLEKRGAKVLRCPLVSIHDSPNTLLVEAWLQQFCQQPQSQIILLTGEGLRRLLGFAERMGNNQRSQFIQRLAEVKKITRGPKPGNALRKIGLKSDLLASTATTQGIIDTLEYERQQGRSLQGQPVAVQLYGTEPNDLLINYLTSQGAVVNTVAPYIYANDVEQTRVEALINSLLAGELDAFAFTSTPQVKRLLQVAKKMDQQSALITALNTLCVAAVGPVVAQTLADAGVAVKIMPTSSYFMKPLVRALSGLLATDACDS